jgi:hypothetical protein
VRHTLSREISYGHVSTSDPDSDPEFTSGAFFDADKSPKTARKSRSTKGLTAVRRVRRTRRSETLKGIPSEPRKYPTQTSADNRASESEKCRKSASQNPLLSFFRRHKITMNEHWFPSKHEPFHPQMKNWGCMLTPLMKNMKIPTANIQILSLQRMMNL